MSVDRVRSVFGGEAFGRLIVNEVLSTISADVRHQRVVHYSFLLDAVERLVSALGTSNINEALDRAESLVAAESDYSAKCAAHEANVQAHLLAVDAYHAEVKALNDRLAEVDATVAGFAAREASIAAREKTLSDAEQKIVALVASAPAKK